MDKLKKQVLKLCKQLSIEPEELAKILGRASKHMLNLYDNTSNRLLLSYLFLIAKKSDNKLFEFKKLLLPLSNINDCEFIEKYELKYYK